MLAELQQFAARPRQEALRIRILALGALMMGVPVQAQGEEPPAHICNVFAGETSAEGLQTVLAGCWGTGLVLGEAEQFQSHTNPELGTVVVELVREEKTRVLLLRARPDGQPMVENLGSVVANAVGRGPLGGIEGLALDFAGFASSGVIGVQEVSTAAPALQMQRQAVSGEASSVTANQIDVGAMVAADSVAVPAEQVAQ